MMNIVKFTKMHGAGNDFILVDDRDANFPIHDHRRIAMMATRRVGVGCEGVIILQKSLVCDFKMVFFNPDGTEAELCGNGARCIAAFAVEIGAVRGRKMRFETAAGEIEAEVLVPASYEGIKGAVAFVVNVLTDNKNRAAAEVGNVFKKNGLEFAKQGAASRLFDRMGQIMIPAADGITEDKVMEVALEAGAEDVLSEDGGFTVKCQPNDFTAVLEAVKGAGIVVDEENSNVGLVPNQPAMVSDVATAKAVQKFVDMLEDLEDVQDVYNNMETTDEVDAALAAEG